MRKKYQHSQGFSLLELLVALGILLILTTFVIGAFTSGLRSIRRESNLALRDSELKRALELMTTEIGQAGTTPEIVDPFINPITGNTGDCDGDGDVDDNSGEGDGGDGDSDSDSGDGEIGCGETAKLSPLAAAGANIIVLNSLSGDVSKATRGLYPGRPLVLGLPEGSDNSEVVKISNISNNTVTLPGVLPAPGVFPASITGLPHTVALNNLGVTSPMLPNMFGILNPPPAMPITADKVIAPNPTNPAANPVRFGFVGDILGDGNLYYVEYTYDYAASALSPTGVIGRLMRSITPVSPTVNPLGSAKAQAATILDNVTMVRFELVYGGANVPIPVSVRIRIGAQTSVPEPTIAGSQARFREVTGSTEIVPRGTSAAALIFASGGEKDLRAMMPPCNTSMTKAEGVGFAPCAAWGTWNWWQNVLNNYAGKNPVTGLAQALP